MVDEAFVPNHRSMSHWDLIFGKPMPGWERNPRRTTACPSLSSSSTHLTRPFSVLRRDSSTDGSNAAGCIAGAARERLLTRARSVDALRCEVSRANSLSRALLESAEKRDGELLLKVVDRVRG